MPRKAIRSSIPPGFVSRNQYPIGQIGGVGSTSLPMYHSNIQAGGNPIAVLAGIGSALKYIQPFSKAKTLLEQHVGEKNKSGTLYKIAHGISSVGASLGLGQSSSIMGPITYQKKTRQPILAKKGMGKKAKSKRRTSRK